MMTSKETNTDMPLWQYIQEKIEMLQDEFKIQLSASEISHMMKLQSEIAVDNYAQTLFIERL